MISWRRILILGLAVVLVCMLVVGLLLRYLISGEAIKDQMVRRAAEKGITLQAESVEVSLESLLGFQPAVEIGGLRVANPAGYSEEPFLNADRVRVGIPLGTLWAGRLEEARVDLDSPAIRIERDREGGSNLTRIVNLLSRQRGSEEGSQSQGKSSPILSYLRVESGRLQFFSESGMQELDLQDLDLTLNDLGATSKPRIELSASLFGSPDSRLRLEGTVGPLQGSGIPVQGSLTAHLVPAQLPIELRRRYAGNLLEAPGDSAAIDLKTKLAGDLSTDVKGPGRVELDNFMLGRDPDHRLALRGQVPLSVELISALSRPRIRFQSEKGELSLGEGHWTGSFGLQFVAGELRGESSGRLENFSIRQLLGTFSQSGERVSGSATLPEYQLSFQGRDPEQLKQSLQGSGVLQVTDGDLGFFDLLGTIEKQAKKTLSGEQTESGKTEFATLGTRFQIANQTVTLKDLVLERADSKISGGGTFGFDTRLNLQLLVPLSNNLLALLGQGSSDREIRLPVLITGSLQSPQVQPDFRQLGIGAARDLLELLFGRKKKPEE